MFNKVIAAMLLVAAGLVGFTTSASAESETQCMEGFFIYDGTSIGSDASFMNWGEGTISSANVTLWDTHPSRVDQVQLGERVLVQLFNGQTKVAQTGVSGDVEPENSEYGEWAGAVIWDTNSIPGATQMNVVHQPDLNTFTPDSVFYTVCVNFTPTPVVEPVCDDNPETPDPEEGCPIPVIECEDGSFVEDGDECPELPPVTEPPATTQPPVVTEPPTTEPPVTTQPPATTEPPVATSQPPANTEPPETTVVPEGPPMLAHTGAETPYLVVGAIFLLTLGYMATKASKTL